MFKNVSICKLEKLELRTETFKTYRRDSVPHRNRLRVGVPNAQQAVVLPAGHRKGRPGDANVGVSVQRRLLVNVQLVHVDGAI